MKKYYLVLLIICSSFYIHAQKLITFGFSECLMECRGDTTRITEFNVSPNLISIKLFTYARCTEALEGGVEYKHGILNLTVKPKPTIVKLKNGKTTEILEVADCDCPYELLYEITGVQSIFQDSVWINMMSIPLINRNARHVEIDVIR